jgi:hypothetical protein
VNPFSRPQGEEKMSGLFHNKIDATVCFPKAPLDSVEIPTANAYGKPSYFEHAQNERKKTLP